MDVGLQYIISWLYNIYISICICISCKCIHIHDIPYIIYHTSYIIYHQQSAISNQQSGIVEMNPISRCSSCVFFPHGHVHDPWIMIHGHCLPLIPPHCTAIRPMPSHPIVLSSAPIHICCPSNLFYLTVSDVVAYHIMQQSRPCEFPWYDMLHPHHIISKCTE